jgi:hypothetical protein
MFKKIAIISTELIIDFTITTTISEGLKKIGLRKENYNDFNSNTGEDFTKGFLQDLAMIGISTVATHLVFKNYLEIGKSKSI